MREDFEPKLISKDNRFTLISDPKVLAVPIRDILEPMIDIRQESDIQVGPSPEIENNQNYTYMRYTVYKKLKEAQKRLPKGYRFCLYEAYRCFELQQQLFDTHLSHLQQQHPNWTLEQQFKEACKLCSPAFHLNGSQNIPPHQTGGAIDVYLINEHGDAVDMGIHPKDWMQDEDGTLSLTLSESISLQAQKHREIMNHALYSVGFINYPSEYWHWSYGDRY